MLSPELTAAIKPQQRIATILWLAMAVSVFLYGVVLFAMQQQGSLSEMAGNNPNLRDVYPLLYPFAGPIALVFAVASVGVGRWLLSASRIRRLLERPVSPEALATVKGRAVDGGRLTLLQALTPEDLQLCALVPHYLSAMLIRLALAEAITVVGFVLTLLGGDPSIILPFAGLSLLLMLFAFPRVGAHIERGRRELLLVPQR